MLNSQDFADRQVRAAVREYHALEARRYTIIKLDLPIQRGWRRFHRPTKDTLLREDHATLEAILGVIGTVVLHPNRQFSRRRGRRGKWVEIEQPLRPIPTYEWTRENYPQKWRPYFRYELILEENLHWQPYWVFTQPAFFELKVERNWLWHFREIDPGVETRLSELDRWLQARQGWKRYDWLKGRGQRCRWKETDTPRQQSLKRLHRREIAQACENFPEVEPAASMQRRPLSLRRHSILPSHFPDVAQLAGGASLRTRTVLVRLQPSGPLFSRPHRRTDS
jgi:hypothetical protein